MNYLEMLNEQQHAAVTYQGGTLLILAGAGSGKTRVITTRIVHMLETYVSTPREILAMTFTNKAAREMKDRVERALGTSDLDLSITTFHSFCARFLRREMEYLEREKSFAIFDAQDQLNLIKRILKEEGVQEQREPPTRLRTVFSRAKNGGSMDQVPENGFHAQLFRRYNELLAQQNAVDFDDLILLTCYILEQFDDCRERYQRRYKHILVDEFQDTNKAQFRLIQLLSGATPDLCVVGDEDQSIYGWRGADINNILDFKDAYPESAVFKLEQNYRSTEPILEFANRVISMNSKRHPKKLWTEATEGQPVMVNSVSNEREEAGLVASFILDEVQPEAYGDVAILFRANYLSRSLEETFRSVGIPYQLVGGLKFYDRKEIKDLMAYARVTVNPKDWSSCCRAMGVPARSLGAKTIERLTPFFATQGSAIGALRAALADNLVSGKQASSLTAFLGVLEQISKAAKTRKPSEWMHDLIAAIDYRSYLERSDEGTAEFRVQNIDELINAMVELEGHGIVSIDQFMDYAALVSDQDELEDGVEKVNLMTVHSAKGLEFDNVFVIGLEDGVFPNQRALDDRSDGLEEERRLFYVAATRARKRLFLSHAKSRYTFGRRMSSMPSRFLRNAVTDLSSNRTMRPQQRIRVGDLGAQLSRIEHQLANKNINVQFKDDLKQPRYRIGDIVEHQTFGSGRIVAFSGRAPAVKVSIQFVGLGTKRFFLDRVPLKKIE